jgi:hypothetical protein
MRHARLSESAAEERLASVTAKFSHLPLRPIRAEAIPLGTRARQLHRRILLADHSIEGLFRLADQFVFRPLLSLLRIVPMIIRLGPRARRECGVPIRRQIRDLLRLVLAHGGKPLVYYELELYRGEAMRDAGAVIMRNEIKHGLMKALNRIDPAARDNGRALGDKLEFARWCAEAGIPHPQPMIVFRRGDAVWQDGALSDLDRDLFVKRRRSRGANGIASYRRTGVFRYVGDDKRPTNLARIIAELMRRARREKLMLQPMLVNHPTIADLTGETLITFRLITCLDEQLHPILTNAYLRSMAKLEPDWDIGRLEEFAAPIDLETGALGRITGDKPDCLSEWFDRHPITGAQVTGRIVPFFPELAQIAIKAHGMCAERVMIGWDMAVTEEGPYMLEGNSFYDTLYPQRIFRQPMGHWRLGELLSFHLDRLEARLDQQ